LKKSYEFPFARKDYIVKESATSYSLLYIIKKPADFSAGFNDKII